MCVSKTGASALVVSHAWLVLYAAPWIGDVHLYSMLRHAIAGLVCGCSRRAFHLLAFWQRLVFGDSFDVENEVEVRSVTSRAKCQSRRAGNHLATPRREQTGHHPCGRPLRGLDATRSRLGVKSSTDRFLVSNAYFISVQPSHSDIAKTKSHAEILHTALS